MQNHHTRLFATYSVVARDADTGQLGVAVQTHQMSVGRVVPWLLPGVGAVATQSLANISFGPMALTLLKEGVSATHVIKALVASDDQANRRQVAVVDSQGRVGAWTGVGCIAEAGHHLGEGYSVQANMMTRASVMQAMSEAYEKAGGDLAQRMMAALEAAQAEDGDIRGMQSAALVVVPGDRHVPEWETGYDLRVDESDNPVQELGRLTRLRRAQLIDKKGYTLLENGQHDAALSLWAQARAIAPELEELAFWQAITLADKHSDLEAATAILKPVLSNDPRRAQWLELIRRLSYCGLIEREGTDAELIQALGMR
jgi:uncharacterized Ntn-hydrolase superfamily protein